MWYNSNGNEILMHRVHQRTTCSSYQFCSRWNISSNIIIATTKLEGNLQQNCAQNKKNTHK